LNALQEQMPVMEGVRVVEAAQWVMAPSAAVILASWGADVIRIEHPTIGDPLRSLIPTLGLDATFDFYVENNNHSKRSIGLDLAKDAGRAVFLDLIADADVFVTSFLEPARQKWGITYEDLREINPRLIYARSHGQGARGPEAHSPGYDTISYWARSSAGAMAAAPGQRPGRAPANGFGDVQGGLALAAGISAALFRRSRTGVGALVDVSLLSVGLWDMYESIQIAHVYGGDPRLFYARGDMTTNPLVGRYQTADERDIQLCMIQSDPHWPGFCQALGWTNLVSDSRFSSFASRSANCADLAALIGERIGSLSLEDLSERLTANGCGYAVFKAPGEIPLDPQVQANGYLVPHPIQAGKFVVSSPIQIDGEPPLLQGAAPEPGQHTEEVLLELGYSWDTISELKEKGVVT
jgi:crotonobetainyl-CoA:carnitine CoA-transferase CaiB-like acyl-CoA transferase